MLTCFFLFLPKVWCNNRNKFSRFRFYFHNEITFGVPLSGTFVPCNWFVFYPSYQMCLCVCVVMVLLASLQTKI